MIALIDADLIAYRCAASCSPTKNKPFQEDLEFAISRCDQLVNRILHEVNPSSHELWLGGGRNYRYDICPHYKANRVDTPKPLHLEDLREYLVSNYGARVTDGIEADDALGIAQCNSYEESVICSIDKDMKQIPGHHFNFVTGIWDFVTPLEGWRNFYIQLVMGDKADNIQGFDGLMRQTIPKFLNPTIDAIKEANSPQAMFEIVQAIYELGDEALLRNGRLLFIQRHEGDQWLVPRSEIESLSNNTEVN